MGAVLRRAAHKGAPVVDDAAGGSGRDHRHAHEPVTCNLATQ